ncbi:MAG: KOW domain-containing RNA-binding protein [Oscillospiraceae bacterium]|nr:KOW domain-containing RNA-binding protein [Oscillospiraceae bacterium]MDD4367760.1 KOW domain-containing RNA-binding protein [Oscillospiraceae bacterium]
MRAVDRLPLSAPDPKIGDIVQSICGHDQGRLYVVTATALETGVLYLRLCDGRLRSLSKPKRKNRKHVRLTVSAADASGDWLVAAAAQTDPESVEARLRKLLKAQQKEVKTKQ